MSDAVTRPGDPKSLSCKLFKSKRGEPLAWGGGRGHGGGVTRGWGSILNGSRGSGGTCVQFCLSTKWKFRGGCHGIRKTDFKKKKNKKKNTKKKNKKVKKKSRAKMFPTSVRNDSQRNRTKWEHKKEVWPPKVN